MKKTAILLGFLSVFAVGCVSYMPFDTKIEKGEEVFAVKGTKDEVFANVIKFASTQRLRVDSTKVISDSATGIVAFSTGSQISEPNMGWYYYVSYSVSVECKNGKIRVTVRNPLFEITNSVNSTTQYGYTSGSEAAARKELAELNKKFNEAVSRTKKDLVDSLNTTTSF